MEKGKFRRGLLFLALSSEYLHLVKNISSENIKSGNPWMVVGEGEFEQKRYDELTKWSDFNIVRPVFFNFYHGIELLLKGLILFNEDYDLNHVITKIFGDFKKQYCDEKEIILLLEKYLIPENLPKPLAACLKENNLDIDKLYEFFRYPFIKKSEKENIYGSLRFKEQEGLELFKALVVDTDVLLKEAVKIFRKIENKKIN